MIRKEKTCIVAEAGDEADEVKTKLGSDLEIDFVNII